MEEKVSRSISVVIPCFNSESTIRDLVKELRFELNSLSLENFEIILVLDGCTDKTFSITNEIAHSFFDVKVYELTRNFGQHAAIFAGIANSNYPLIVTMDDDGQHLPKEIKKLIDKFDEGFDVVYGVPFKEEHGYFRSFSSRFFKRLLYKLLDINQARNISAFRLFKRTLVDEVDLQSLGAGVLDIVLHWSTTKFGSVSVTMKERQIGSSSYTFSKLIKIALELVTGYSTKPLRLASVLGLVGFATSILGSILILFGKVTGSIDSPGYASLILAVLIFGSIQLLTLGIVGEYLARIHERSMGKPFYLIKKHRK